MRGLKLLVLGATLLAAMMSLGALVNGYQRHAARWRSQPLVALIESENPEFRRSFGISFALPTSQTVANADALLLPKVQALLQRGIPANAWGRTSASYNGRREFTPLMLAAMHRLPLTAGALLRAGADPNVMDPDGRTALILAVRKGNSAVMQVLLQHGADPNVVDRGGQTALDYAHDYGLGWERKEALLRPLKQVRARPGPYALRHENPKDRFRFLPNHVEGWNSQTMGDGIRYESVDEMTLPEGAVPLLTRQKFERLRVGMSYGEVAAILGGERLDGTMGTEYTGTLTLAEGKHQLVLDFYQARVSGKHCTGL